jgi:anaerobic ribonucleoside-triphosphate reductase activating protein
VNPRIWRDDMNYADYYDCDICNGKSVGMSLFVSGCPIHCKGCFNPETWDFNYGKKWTPEIEEKFLDLVSRDYIKRVSFLGGSPLCDENVSDVMRIIHKIKSRYPDKKIWVYTGYTWESIMAISTSDSSLCHNARKEILQNIDVLVDGNFDLNKRNITLPFRGSSNQRIIDVPGSLKTNQVILIEEKE